MERGEGGGGVTMGRVKGGGMINGDLATVYDAK